MGITRIRYEKKDEKTEISVRNIYSKGNNCMYIVEIDLETCTYRIKNVNSKRVYSGGENVNSLVVLKRNIKKHLSDLGVEFGFEIRHSSKE